MLGHKNAQNCFLGICITVPHWTSLHFRFARDYHQGIKPKQNCTKL